MYQQMKIYIGNDHAGPEYVQEIITHLKDKGFNVEHVGSFGDESVDYPDFGKKVAKNVVENNAMGVVICGTGIGISIAANKVDGAIAANCRDTDMAALSRQHNNANIIGIGARFVPIENAKKMLDVFFQTQFEGGRHERRVEKIHKKV